MTEIFLYSLVVWLLIEFCDLPWIYAFSYRTLHFYNCLWLTSCLSSNLETEFLCCCRVSKIVDYSAFLDDFSALYLFDLWVWPPQFIDNPGTGWISSLQFIIESQPLDWSLMASSFSYRGFCSNRVTYLSLFSNLLIVSSWKHFYHWMTSSDLQEIVVLSLVNGFSFMRPVKFVLPLKLIVRVISRKVLGEFPVSLRVVVHLSEWWLDFLFVLGSLSQRGLWK